MYENSDTLGGGGEGGAKSRGGGKEKKLFSRLTCVSQKLSQYHQEKH